MSLESATAPQTRPPDYEIPDYTPPAGEPPQRDARFAVLDAPEPTTDADLRAERVAVVTLYSDLARKAGEERMEISTTMTGTLKDECRRLIKSMDLL